MSTDKEKQEAWDRFAAAALSGYLATFAGSGEIPDYDSAAEIAAAYANSMIDQRDQKCFF